MDANDMLTDRLLFRLLVVIEIDRAVFRLFLERNFLQPELQGGF